MKKIILVLLLFLSFCINIYADEISDKEILLNDNSITSLSDNNYSTKINISNEDKISIKSNSDIYHIYIIYELKSSKGILNINDDVIELGNNNYLHEYVDLTKNHSKEINITYKEDTMISEIYIFDNKNLPSFVQKWTTNNNEVDLMLISTHSDDEHLFFAGLIPHFLNQDKIIQVVYFTNHNATPSRLHEQLNGLWAVGLTTYPEIGPFKDAYSTTLDGALNNLSTEGYNLDDAIKFQVNMIRKYKPLVVVGHDEKGEYSHGQHILNTHSLQKATELVNDDSYITDYKKYQLPKLYLHLYEQNKITMDYDVPLKKYDNKTAYEVSKLGYKEHTSQQYTWFTDWLNGKNNSYTSSKEITKYSPLEFGLFYTTVGEDKNKNDMFENTINRNTLTNKIKKYVLSKKINHEDYYKYYAIIGGLIILIIMASIKKRK